MGDLHLAQAIAIAAVSIMARPSAIWLHFDSRGLRTRHCQRVSTLVLFVTNQAVMLVLCMAKVAVFLDAESHPRQALFNYHEVILHMVQCSAIQCPSSIDIHEHPSWVFICRVGFELEDGGKARAV